MSRSARPLNRAGQSSRLSPAEGVVTSYTTRLTPLTSSMMRVALAGRIAMAIVSDSNAKQREAHESAVSRRNAPELSVVQTLLITRGRREDRVPTAPMVRVQQKARGRTTGSAGTPGLPCAMVLRLIRGLPGETGLCCHRHRRDAEAS